MKKVFLFLVVFLISASSFANWSGTFTTSCGKVTHATVHGSTKAEYIAGLQAINEAFCGTSNVTITFY
jgi:hypothetical protein